MLRTYSFQIGIFRGKLLKRPEPDVGCCAAEEEEDIVFKIHATVK
jgi:hypothetical protein